MALRSGKESANRDGDLVEHVFRDLKVSILQYELRPGQRLATAELAERFGVSRTPVTQALARLEREEFVAWRPNRGYYVAEMDPRNAWELFELREALEAFAVEQATTNHSEEQLASIEARMQEYGELGAGPLTRQKLLLDRAFHIALAKVAGNSKLHDSLDSVFERLIMKRNIEGAPTRGEVTVEEHRAIFDAVRAQDVPQAVRLMREHVRGSRDNLMEHLRQRRALFTG